MPPLTNQEFFTKLTALIESRQQKSHGSVFLTQKRLSYQEDASITVQQGAQFADLNPPKALPILVRASDGDTQDKSRKKNAQHVKFTTIVQPDDIESFFATYAEVCRAGMQSLKKRDRSKQKRRKKKATTAEDDKKA